MKAVCLAPALAGLFLVSSSSLAVSLDDIQLWTGSGTNRAAVVIEWNTPKIFNNTSVPAPVANKTMVWGYRFDGAATGTEMFNAVVAANPGLYAVEDIDPAFGTGVDAIGFNRDGNGVKGVTDGTTNYSGGAFAHGLLINPKLDLDAASPLNSGDLFWSGFGGPYWQVWTELGDHGGFSNSPRRGSSPYWNPDTYAHGEWASANFGLDDLPVTDGSWLGFSISAAGYDSNTNDPAYNIFNNDEEAPPSPEGNYTAYVSDTNDFAVQIISTTNIDPSSPYNDPSALLNRPSLRFVDIYDGGGTDRVSIVNSPYNKTPEGGNVLTEISAGGQVTLKLGRKVYDDPNNPYGIDLIVYGNSFFSASGFTGTISDEIDLGAASLGAGIYGHATTVSVSQDGTNWYSYSMAPDLYPQNAYRWDDGNGSWTDEEMNPTKPLNPFVYTNNLTGLPVAGALDLFAGASGGTGFDLRESGLPWVQYVRVQPGPGVYTVVDAIAAVNPAVVGESLTIAPDNLASGLTNLAFQNPGDKRQNLIAIHFESLGAPAKVSTVGLSDFSSFAPVPGNVSSAFQIRLKPLSGTNAAVYLADVGLRVGGNYSGNGGDLRVYSWAGSNWSSRPFAFNPTNSLVSVEGLASFTAFVISQIIPPQLRVQPSTNGYAVEFAPVANCAQVLERSTNLAAWTPILTNAPTGAATVTMVDTAAPRGIAFYRVRVNP